MTTPIFEAAFWKHWGGNPNLRDALFGLMDALVLNPRAVGRRHPAYEFEMWIYESPRLIRMPRHFVLYEISDDKGQVILWHFGLAR